PQDARPSADGVGTLVSMNRIYDALNRCRCGTRMVLADASRNDPTTRECGAGADTQVRPTRGTGVLYSCAAGEVSYEYPKFKHGVFFHFVLEGLRGKAKNAKMQVTFHSLADYVSEEVAQSVPRLIGDGAQQRPHFQATFDGPSPVLIGR